MGYYRVISRTAAKEKTALSGILICIQFSTYDSESQQNISLTMNQKYVINTSSILA
jgi:hypothetical protein